ncbi:hypothetical protein GCM10011571_28960 [Marinithermofilum abyssi]|uniref:YlzJ-like protein n=1 Tax=Marinithermofilum abyssi TaxID=1571185 RepID=A0A8J2YE66_9BACL|nr:YlzJ-like family protein [Marinithermofilum abyssi]GGE25001.1 hypothetical protein GCM10011571_28960 [Marinithermofilum abyssi]
MIHYSVVPADMVFYDPTLPQPEYREAVVEGVPMLVEQVGLHDTRIVRLLSMDPAHYLDPRFQPGSRL